MKNENRESQSDGMELLENVLKSNIANTEQNIKLEFAIGDHTTLLNEVQMSLKVVNLNCENLVGMLELEQTKRVEFIASIPTQIEAVLSKETTDYLESLGKDIRWKKKFIWSGIGVSVLAVLVLIGTINFATKWYKESIKAKSELRQDILNEIANKGKKIYQENEIKILQENTQVMQLWIKSSPKKADDFLRFKDGFEANKQSK